MPCSPLVRVCCSLFWEEAVVYDSKFLFKACYVLYQNSLSTQACGSNCLMSDLPSVITRVRLYTPVPPELNSKGHTHVVSYITSSGFI